MALTLRRDKGFALTFDEMDDNFLAVAGGTTITVSETQPEVRNRGDGWFDTSPSGSGSLLLWDGDAWIEVIGSGGGGGGGSSITVSDTAPVGPTVGAGWFDTSGTDESGLFIWSGSAWLDATGAGSTPASSGNPLSPKSILSGTTKVSGITAFSGVTIAIPEDASGCTFMAKGNRSSNKNPGTGFGIVTNNGQIDGVVSVPSENSLPRASTVSIDFTTGSVTIITADAIGTAGSYSPYSIDVEHLNLGPVTSLQLGGSHADSESGSTNYSWSGLFY